jgi:HK97 family phage portal protein
MRPPHYNWFQRSALKALGLLHVKSSAATSAILAMSPGEVVWKTKDYRSFAIEGYARCSDAHSCISLISTCIKGVRVFPYTEDGKGNRTEITSGPLSDLLRRPNPEQGWEQFIGGLVTYLFTAGNVYVERGVGSSPEKAPTELWLPRPDRIEIEKGDKLNPIKGFRYIPPLNLMGSVNWPGDFIKGRGLVQRLLHLKFFHPYDDWYGLSPIEVCARNIDQNNEAQAWNVSVLQNGMRPSGAFVVEGSLSDEQRENVQGVLDEKHSGAQNAGRTILIEGGKADYKQFSMNATEMSWLEGQSMATRRICAVFKVPPQLIGDEQAKTYANYQEAHRALWMLGVLPVMDFVFSELTHWLAPFFGDGIKIGYDRDDIEAIQEDRQVIHDRAVKSLEAGVITLNEARKLIGQNPLPGKAGDIFYIPMQMIPTPLKQLDSLADAKTQNEMMPDKPPLPAPGAKPALPNPRQRNLQRECSDESSYQVF